MIVAERVQKSYGERTALKETSVTFADGQTTALIGPSGCGKSTLLRVVVGLIQPDQGQVAFDGEVMTAANAEVIRRKIGFVLQDGGLFPHLTARKNCTLLADVLGKEVASKIPELADLVKLPVARLQLLPRSLSGGERQRVSLLRALILDPRWVLLDEPLGALDPITRRALQTDLRDIFLRLKKTVVFVTHDMGEAAYLGDSVVLMRGGQIVQQGGIRALIDTPADSFVTEFLRAQRNVDEERT